MAKCDAQLYYYYSECLFTGYIHFSALLFMSLCYQRKPILALFENISVIFRYSVDHQTFIIICEFYKYFDNRLGDPSKKQEVVENELNNLL